MSVKFLSQITQAGSPPASTDFLVGVGGGTTDLLYTLTQVGSTLNTFAFVVGSGNTLNFYVSATGSDSNDGLTVGTAWATPQHAVNYISANVNFGGGIVILNIGIGVFPGVGIPTFVGGGIFQIYGAGSSSTTLTGGDNDGVLNLGEVITVNVQNQSTIAFQGVTIQASAVSPGFAVYATGINAIIGDAVSLANSDIIFDNTNFTSYFIINWGTGSLITLPPSTGVASINLQGQDMGTFYWCRYGAVIVNHLFWNVFQDTTILNAWARVDDDATIFDLGGYSPDVATTQTGPQVLITGGSHVASVFADSPLGIFFFPGTTFGTVDSVSTYDNFFFATPTQASGDPTTSDLPDDGTWGVFTDGSGDYWVAANASGTIKKVALS